LTAKQGQQDMMGNGARRLGVTLQVAGDPAAGQPLEQHIEGRRADECQKNG